MHGDEDPSSIAQGAILRTQRRFRHPTSLPRPSIDITDRTDSQATTVVSTPVAETPTSIKTLIGEQEAVVETGDDLGKRAAASLTDPSALSGSLDDLPDLRNAQERRRGRLYVFAICLSFFTGGWIDGSMGPLIPAIRENYSLSFGNVSLLFTAASLGFIFGGAVLNMLLSDRLGMGKMMPIGAACQLVGLSIQASAPPFAVFAVACSINSIGWGLQVAQGNSYLASTPNNRVRLGVSNAFYGVGALVVPLVATQFAQFEGKRYSYHFLVSLGIAFLNTVSIASILRGRKLRELLLLAGASTPSTSESQRELDQEPPKPASSSFASSDAKSPVSFTLTSDLNIDSGVDARKSRNANSFSNILRYRGVYFLCLWSLVYVGMEVTTGGWVVTYLREKRGGGATAGYGSTGFYGGLTLGRLLLLPLNKKIGERRVYFFYMFLAIILQLLVWHVPSLIVSALSFSLIGFCFGPMWILAMTQASRILPLGILPGAVGLIAAAGNVGCAILPWGTGTLMERWGVGVCAPFILSIMGLTTIAWALVPTTPSTSISSEHDTNRNGTEPASAGSCMA